MSKIFEPYFTTKNRGKGTGLGLAVAYGIVKEHEGDITIDTSPGKGTTFNIFLPILETETFKIADNAASDLPTGNEHILLVDDEASIINIEKQMLTRLGYTVTSRVNSLEALEMFKNRPDRFDLVITDMTMPNMTGVRLAEALTEIRSDIPVIICTGYSERIDEEKAGSLGIKGLLMKPVVKSKLAETVRNVLDDRL